MKFPLLCILARRRASSLVLLGALLALAGCAQSDPQRNSFNDGDVTVRTARSTARDAAPDAESVPAFPVAAAGVADADTSRAPEAAFDGALAGPRSASRPGARPNALPESTTSDDASSFAPACACGVRFQQKGMATWYGTRFHGRRTASGERYDMHAFTAAHRSLPMGACVRVTALGSTRSVIVRINDRGPFVAGRIIDLSYAAAQALGFGGAGNLQVALERVKGARRCEEAGA